MFRSYDHLQAEMHLLGFTRLTTDPFFVEFYCLLLLKLLHVSVVRPSSRRNILARITRLTTDRCFQNLVNIMDYYSDRLIVGCLVDVVAVVY
jgi:hypothetical protein